jgi:nicotinamide-nucleotide amidase
LRITAHGDDKTLLIKKTEELAHRIEERVGEFIFGYDNTSLENEIGISLRKQKKTIGTAESLTGGLIAHKITLVAGASDYFKGSIVAYSNEVKKNLLGVKEETLNQFGAVSEETIREMVAGALNLLQTDYVVAVSGIAGPAGGTPEKPVGTVWIGVGSHGRIIAKKLFFSRTREIIMELTAVSALGMVWRFINGRLAD